MRENGRVCEWWWGGDGKVSSTLGGKRYCGDRDALSLKCCGAIGTRTECGTWGLCVLGGGGGRRYCGDRAGAAVNIFGAGEEGAGVRCAAGLGIEAEWCWLGGGGKSATDCGEGGRSAVVLRARDKLRVSNLTPQLVSRAAGSLSSLIGSRNLLALIVDFFESIKVLLSARRNLSQGQKFDGGGRGRFYENGYLA
mmetsp:Transcript_38752/g.75672  ORF Transcript_38752/g.75672 Transcript_38752/m.75672 type:complete len:195 (-) Transcript_38752:669-1253(-)